MEAQEPEREEPEGVRGKEGRQKNEPLTPPPRHQRRNLILKRTVNLRITSFSFPGEIVAKKQKILLPCAASDTAEQGLLISLAR